MLVEYLEKLSNELEIKVPELNKDKSYLITVGAEVLKLKDLEPGFEMEAKIREIPQKNREELFVFLMRGNLLGQGTGSSRIGIDLNEKFLTLSLGLPYELNYEIFRESIEDFVNFLIYWREEVSKFESKESMY